MISKQPDAFNLTPNPHDIRRRPTFFPSNLPAPYNTLQTGDSHLTTSLQREYDQLSTGKQRGLSPDHFMLADPTYSI